MYRHWEWTKCSGGDEVTTKKKTPSIAILTALVAWSMGAAAALAEAEDQATGLNQIAGAAFTPNVNLSVIVPRTPERPRIDGHLDEAMWANALRLGNFCEISPGDNTKPSCKTEALFAYDDQNFYMGFICCDDSPEQIRASMSDRDDIFGDDFVGVILDTFGDKQNSYELFINPYGIQGDLRRTYNNEDASFDTIWESGGHINSKGWVAEAAIPFRSIRFPDQHQQEWLMHILRIRPRNSREQHSWAPLDRDESCLLCQAGTFRGMEGVNSGKNLEILPYAIASQSGSLKDEENPALGFENAPASGEAGVGVKYGITPNLTLDFTYNPDFSQVEADAAQVDVNTTFALFFSEKRPFFLEGREIFNSRNLIYTRSLNDPMMAAKLTGKMGKFTVGYILGRDDYSPFVVPFEDNSEIAVGGKSVSNILRVKRDILSDSYVGLIATDRRLDGGGSNSLVVADASVRFMENYRLNSQIGFSDTKEPDDPSLSSDFADTTFGRDKHTTVFDGETYRGNTLHLELERDARYWNFEVYYNDLSPTFRANNGFITNNNYRSGGFWTGVLFQPNGRVFEKVQPQFNYGLEYNHDDVFKDTWVSPSIWIQFKRQTNMWMGYLKSRERFKGVLIEGIERLQYNIHSNASDILQGGMYFQVGRSIARGEDPPILGHERYFEAWGTLKPTSRLKSNFTYVFAKMMETESGPNLYEGYIIRNRLSYQFNRRLFLRLVTQYNDFSRRMEIDPLLSYKINPFTVFYVGSTHDVENFTGEDYGDLGYRQTNRQFFAKIQYLFRI
jgi:hypothetical protein